jgi:predicted GNAT family acetyltransferase
MLMQTFFQFISEETTSKMTRNLGVDGGWSSNSHKITVHIGKKKIGEAGVKEHTKAGKKHWTITTSRVNPSLVGKGFGKHVYNALVHHAKHKKIDVLQSSDKHRSPGAEHAWSELSKRYKAKKQNGIWKLKF